MIEMRIVEIGDGCRPEFQYLTLTDEEYDAMFPVEEGDY
jgi:hypothetical protein